MVKNHFNGTIFPDLFIRVPLDPDRILAGSFAGSGSRYQTPSSFTRKPKGSRIDPPEFACGGFGASVLVSASPVERINDLGLAEWVEKFHELKRRNQAIMRQGKASGIRQELCRRCQ